MTVGDDEGTECTDNHVDILNFYVHFCIGPNPSPCLELPQFGWLSLPLFNKSLWTFLKDDPLSHGLFIQFNMINAVTHKGNIQTVFNSGATCFMHL